MLLSRTTIKFIPAAAVIALLIGCAAPQAEIAPWEGAAAFPRDDVAPRVVIYGDLSRHLPKYQEMSSLELFLYGPSGDESLPLRNPQGMVALGHRLLVCDQGREAIIEIDLSNGRTKSFCDSSLPPRCPVDVEADAAGIVYVADTTRRCVLTYGSDGAFRASLSPNAAAPDSFRPCGLAIVENILYVGDLARRRIERFDLSNARWLESFEPSSDLPSFVAPVGLCRGPSGEVLIADTVRGLIYRVTPAGQWLTPFGGPGRGPGQLIRPKQVCCSQSGLIFVTDTGRQSICVFDSRGNFFAEMTERPPAWRGWTLPMGIAFLPQEATQALSAHVETPTATKPAECLLVSDTLGAPSLTLLGLIAEYPEDRHAD